MDRDILILLSEKLSRDKLMRVQKLPKFTGKNLANREYRKVSRDKLTRMGEISEKYLKKVFRDIIFYEKEANSLNFSD